MLLTAFLGELQEQIPENTSYVVLSWSADVRLLSREKLSLETDKIYKIPALTFSTSR
jgi:hypothetical protein